MIQFHGELGQGHSPRHLYGTLDSGPGITVAYQIYQLLRTAACLSRNAHSCSSILIFLITYLISEACLMGSVHFPSR